jgi:membrane dipeptidase
VSVNQEKADLMAVVDHIEHIASVIGRKQYVSLSPRHRSFMITFRADSSDGISVGLGSDFDGMDTTTNGIEDVSDFPALVCSPHSHSPDFFDQPPLHVCLALMLL